MLQYLRQLSRLRHFAGSVFKSLYIIDFLETPINIGFCKTYIVSNYLIFDNYVLIVFPNPKPGSIIISQTPFFCAKSIFFDKFFMIS